MKQSHKMPFGLDLKDKKTALIIRFVGYAFMMATATLIAMLLVAGAQGYDVNRSTGEVIRNGLILVNSSPESSIFVGGVDEEDATPGRLPLPEGSYDIELKRDGFRDWRKSVTLVGSEVEWLYYPRLYPQEISSTIVQDFDSIAFAEQSPDQKWLIMAANSSVPELLLTDVDNPENDPEPIILPQSVFSSSSNAFGDIKFVEWSANSELFIVQHRYNETVEYIVVNREAPEQAININQLLALDVKDVRFKGESGADFYGRVGDTFREIRLADTIVSAPLLRNVVQYDVHDSETVLYVLQSSAISLVEIGVLRSGERFIISTQPATNGPFFLGLERHSNRDYMAVGASGRSELSIYRNPIEQRQAQDENSPLRPFAQMRMDASSIQSVAFTENGQFVMARSGAEFLIYNIDQRKRYGFKLDSSLYQAASVRWLDNHRFVLVDSEDSVAVVEFDGENLQNLGQTTPRLGAFFDRNQERLLRFEAIESNKKIVLLDASLVK